MQPNKVDDRSLSNLAASGVVKTAAGQILKIGTQFASIVVLTRFLAPSDYGLMAIILAITGIANLICDMGLSLATTQAKNLSLEQRNKVFWINTLIGVSLSILLVICAHPLAHFYDLPEIGPVATIMALTFLFAGVTAQYRASLVRALQFGRIAVVEVGAQAAALIAAIIMASGGMGYWSLVAQALGSTFLTMLGMILFGRWLPRFSFKSAPISDLLKFGSSTMATQLVNYASVNTPSLALGRLSNMGAVGLYAKGFQIFSLPLTQIAAPLTSVALPTLSRIREEPERFARYTSYAQMTLVYCLGLMMCLIAVGGSPLLSVVLGEQWAEAGTVVQILSIGGLFQIMGYVNYWIFLAKNRMPVLLVFEGCLRVSMIPLVIFGAMMGLRSTAAAYSIGLAMIWIGSTFFGLRRVGVSARNMMRSTIRPLLLILIVFITGAFIREILLRHAIENIMVLTVSYTSAAVAGASFLLLRGYRKDLSIMLSGFQQIRKP